MGIEDYTSSTLSTVQRGTRLDILKERTKIWGRVDFSISTFSIPQNSCLPFLFFLGKEETRDTKAMDGTLENYVSGIATALCQGMNRMMDELVYEFSHTCFA